MLNNCLTANKKYEIDYENVLASVGFNSGRHYWEIKLDTFVEMEDIFVGVARRNIDLYIRAWDTGSFWGWICAGYDKLVIFIEEGNSVQHLLVLRSRNMEAFQKSMMLLEYYLNSEKE